MILENDETSLFRHSWSLYDALAEMNYMHHQEIYACVAELMRDIHQRGPWTIMDLGCGNARFLAPCLISTTPEHYIGIDLSPPALEEAHARFLAELPSCTLHCANMLTFMETSPPLADVVFSSFAVHHLSLDEKKRLFLACAKALRPNGLISLVDVAREEDQDRQSYLASYIGAMRSQWICISDSDLDAACAHVQDFDYPETLSTLRSMAKEAGLNSFELKASYGAHKVIVIRA
jgi:SAM-dependent methyltransferase